MRKHRATLLHCQAAPDSDHYTALVEINGNRMSLEIPVAAVTVLLDPIYLAAAEKVAAQVQHARDSMNSESLKVIAAILQPQGSLH